LTSQDDFMINNISFEPDQADFFDQVK
jgi:hypothetical protein